VVLVVAWTALLVAVLAVGVTLHASIAYGERRSRFASAVTHELRTPLTTFRMYSEMLSEGMVQDEARKASYLQTLHSEADRLSRLVENVLAYARLERGRSEIKLERIDLRSLIERLLPPLKRRTEEAEVELHLASPIPEDVAVQVDPEAAGQILYNLVDNACKYARVGGRIDLTVQKENGRVCVDVRDHGPGVSAEHAGRIFEAFDRGAREPGDTTPGVGLGLALSRGLARKLGGDLTLDRSCRGGACFRLSLPAG
jgi:signal transduction histidine kinase